MILLFLFEVVLSLMVATSTSTMIMVASTGSIQQEGNAMADIARAIPGLTTLSGMDRFYVHIVRVSHGSLFLRCGAMR